MCLKSLSNLSGETTELVILREVFDVVVRTGKVTQSLPGRLKTLNWMRAASTQVLRRRRQRRPRLTVTPRCSVIIVKRMKRESRGDYVMVGGVGERGHNFGVAPVVGFWMEKVAWTVMHRRSRYQGNARHHGVRHLLAVLK